MAKKVKKLARKSVRKPARKQPRSKVARKPRRGPKVPTLAELQAAMPDPQGVAALEGMLDAVETVAKEKGVTGLAAPAMRAAFGMLLGVAIADGKGAVLEVDGVGSIPIRKQDAQFVAMKGLTDLTRLHVNEMMTRLVGKGAIKLSPTALAKIDGKTKEKTAKETVTESDHCDKCGVAGDVERLYHDTFSDGATTHDRTLCAGCWGKP
jgi:hypothetical protein